VAFVQIVAIPGVTEGDFRAHVNGKLGEGYCVLDYWSSKAAGDEFMQIKVGPAVAASGITAEPMIEELAVHNSLTQQTPASV
jgi:hypothetical protein